MQGDFDGLSSRHFNDVKMDNRKRTLLIGTSGDQEMDKKDGNLPMGVYPTRNRKYQAIIHFYLNLTDDFPCGLGTYSNVETASKADDSVAQVLCEAGCLLKKRLAAGKETPVFAVLTNGLLFRFFAIDTNGVVYSSGLPPIGLGFGSEGDYTNSPTLSEILRWFT